MNKKNWFRYLILIFFFIAFTVFSIRHFLFGGGVSASVDALCPFGGIETLYTFLMTGSYVPRILISGLILTTGIILTALIFKRAFCGWICPFGTIQEFLGKIRKKIFIPEKADKYAKYTKYLVLLLILAGTAITGTLVFRSYDPFITFFHFGNGIFWGSEETTGAYLSFSIMIIVLLLAVFIERFWCRYLCPLGASITLFSWIGLSKIKRDKKTCINCKICNKVCPSRIDVAQAKTIKDVECIDCMRCVDSCPKKSLSINIFGKKISKTVFALSFIALFFGLVGASMLVGIWQSVPSTDLKNNNGAVDVNNIKGWMSLNEVSKSVGIPIETICQDLGLPSNVDVNTNLKEISSKYQVTFDTEALREYVKNFDYTKLTQKEKEVQCPWGIHNDTYPGQCGFYIDEDHQRICDLSE